jgi:hypothetical protein
VILWKTSHMLLKENYAMTANTSIDPARFLQDQLASASPGSAACHADHVHRRVDGRGGRRGLRRPVRRSEPGPDQFTPVATTACTLTTRPPSRTFSTSASAATNVYGPGIQRPGPELLDGLVELTRHDVTWTDA